MRDNRLRPLTLILPILILVGCSTGIVVHDENRAAELVVDFLSGIKSAEGAQLSYEWTDDKYKEEVSRHEFMRIVSSIRDKNQGAEIFLNGYEVFGPVETIIVYASSQASEGKMYLRLILAGTKTKDYYLLKLSIADSEFSKEGIYNEYGRPISVKGV